MSDATATQRDVGMHRKVLRTKAEMTIRGLALAAGVSHPTVLAAEAGTTVNEGTLRKLAAALGCTAAEYLGPDLAP